VSDIVQANLLAMKTQEGIGRIFNVGSGRGTSVLQLANLLRSKLNPGATIEFEPARAEELRNSIADISLASHVLGYTPRTNLAAQLPEVIESIRRS